MRSFTLMTSTEGPRRRFFRHATLAAAALVLAACASDDPVPGAASDSAATDGAPTESVPFADDPDVDPITNDELREDPFEDDDTDSAPDVAPETPLTDGEIAALLADDPATATRAATDDDAQGRSDAAPDPGILLGEPEDDATHVGRIEATAEALMRELALAYGGSGELLAEPIRHAEGGSMSFALTELPGGPNFRVDVEFGYVADVDQPDMIVGHRADRITLTPFSNDG